MAKQMIRVFIEQEMWGAIVDLVDDQDGAATIVMALGEIIQIYEEGVEVARILET
jgi:hypothetical protein